MAKRNKDEEYEYDPIKVSKDGKQAEKVVWTTKALKAAVDGLAKGLPLKANPFIGKNTLLLKPDLVYKRTQEEIEDYIKCMKDPVYFGSKCFLMTPTGLQACKLRDYQENYLRHLQKNRFSIFLSCRQSGKTLNMLTRIVIKVKNDEKNLDSLIKEYYFYIKDNYVYINLPIFELYHFLDSSLIGNIRYFLYKLIYNLQL